jgi:hypothetical protein
MAYTTDHLLALETALAKGESSVTFQDRTVTYRSVADLKLAILEVKRGLQGNEATNNGIFPTRQIRVTTSKGF